jgi:hypothetical protein
MLGGMEIHCLLVMVVVVVVVMVMVMVIVVVVVVVVVVMWCLVYMRCASAEYFVVTPQLPIIKVDTAPKISVFLPVCLIGA